MRLTQLAAAAVLAGMALTVFAPAASAEPFYCVYVYQQRVAHLTIRSMEVCVL
jgi:hypothetical protein